MNIRKYFLSNIPYSPDDPAVAPAGDPPVVVAPVAGDGDPQGDPPAVTPEPAPEAPPAPAKTPWFMTRLAEEGEKVRAAAARAEAAEREAANLRAQIEAGGAAPAAPAPAAPVARQPGQSQAEFEAAVRREVDGRQLLADTTFVLNNGLAKFPDFAQSRDTLTALGATADDFVLDVMAADRENAHVIFDQLAKNPEKAVALTRMPSRQRLAELVRMSTAIAPKAPAPAAPAAPALSKAPKPAPSLAPVSDGGGDDPLVSDAGTDEEFSAAWDRKFKGPRAVA